MFLGLDGNGLPYFCASFTRRYSISKSIVPLLPSPCRATALSAARRLDTIDLEMELDATRKLI